MNVNAFDPIPPEWTQTAIHAQKFCCPSCQDSCMKAVSVWMNRRSPVFTEENGRKWQEFYHCHCGQPWWAWSSDRPPSPLKQRDRSP